MILEWIHSIRKIFILVISFTLLSIPGNLFPQEKNDSDESLILSLINKFSDENPFTNGEAISEIIKYGEKAVDLLIVSLSNKNENVRLCSAIALGKIAPAGKKAIPFLTKALTDNNSDVKWCVSIALGNFYSDAKSSVTELQKLLSDDDEHLRWAAYTSLLKIDSESIHYIPELSGVINKLDTLTPQLMNELKVPGVSISLIKNFRIEWSKAFGMADASTRAVVTEKTIFEACSMSKPVFAFLVLQLAEQGKIDLDKPLYNYLPEKFVSENEDYSKQITARMILSHSSGLPNWRKGGDERLAPLPIYFKPGTKFNYSGEGIYYLQRVVEHVTQQTLDTYSKEILFDKLGFESTSFVWTENLDSKIATGHDTSGNCNNRSRYVHPNAAYTLYTTPEEYAKFIIEIMKPDALKDYSLSDKTISEMLKHQIRVDTREVINRPGRSLGLQSYRGLGWAIDSTITGDIVYHSGANQTGFRCYSQFNMRDGSGIVIMTNGENGSELWQRMIKEIGDL